MSTTEPKKVEVAVQVGTGINAYVVNVVAWQRDNGSLNVQLSPNMNGNATSEEVALRMLQRDPSSVLKQVNRALKKAGVEGVDDDAEVVETKVMPGPEIPLHKNDPRLNADFLATLVVAARSHGHGGDYPATLDFLRYVFDVANIQVPAGSTLEPFTHEQMDEAALLDGKGPTPDGVMPKDEEDNKVQ